jgi:hypothetical protein
LINQARTPSETLMSSASRVDVLGMIDFVQTCIRAKIAAEEKGDDL